MRCFKRCALKNRVKFSVLNPVCINAGNCCKAQCCEVSMTKTENQSGMTGFSVDATIQFPASWTITFRGKH